MLDVHQHDYRDGYERNRRAQENRHWLRLRRAKDHLAAASSLVSGAVLAAQVEQTAEAREQLTAALAWLDEVR